MSEVVRVSKATNVFRVTPTPLSNIDNHSIYCYNEPTKGNKKYPHATETNRQTETT